MTSISMLKEKAWKKWACSELVLLFDRVLEVQTQSDKHQYVEGKGLEGKNLPWFDVLSERVGTFLYGVLKVQTHMSVCLDLNTGQK